jgi:osmotically-inducible protein OsmY
VISTIQRERCCSDRSEQVVREAQECLDQSSYSLLRQVSVEYERGVLFLRGRLPNYYHKQLAQEAVRRVDGVAHVVNEIEVSHPRPR